MDPVFEDVKRELVNRMPKRFAGSYDEFVDRMLRCIQSALNTEDGQAWIDPLLAEAIRTNMSPEDWHKQQVNIMLMVFFLTLDEIPMLKRELAYHLYNELRKEP